MNKSKSLPLMLLLFTIFLPCFFSDSVAKAGAGVNQTKYTFYSDNIKYEIIKPASAKKPDRLLY